jgi:Fur family ferric uptake transcriptional regulator
MSLGMIRRTKQREAITAVLTGTDRPLTAAEVYKRARLRANSLGLRTVFRRLKALLEDGRLVKLDYPGQPPRYEWVDGHNHPHFICHSCAKTFNFKKEAPDVPYAPPPGFHIKGQEVVFYGLCPTCGGE